MKKLLKDAKIRNGIVIAILVVLIIAVVAAPMAGTLFTFLSEDDFSYESGGLEGAAQFQSSFLGSLYKVKVIYMNQQGCYTPMFIDHFIRPYSRAGLPGYHFTLFLYISLYVISLAVVSYVLTRKTIPSLAVMLLAAMSTFAMSSTAIDRDIFYWYTGTVGYSVMIMLILFNLFCLIQAIRCDKAKRTIYLIISILLSFIASGAPLVLASVNCSFILAVIILNHKKINDGKYLLLPFASAFIGAIINSVAPGNFIRAGEDINPGHETLLDGVRDAFSCLFKSYPQAVDVVFVFSALALFVICLLYKVDVLDEKITHIRMAIIVGGVFLIQYFEVFPGAYGYHSDVFDGHMLIVHLIVTRLTLIFVVISLAQWFRENFLESDSVEGVKAFALLRSPGFLKAACCLFVILILVLPSSRNVLKSGFSAMTYRDFRSGAMVRVYRIREYQLSTFEMADDGSDCVIYTGWDTTSESLPALGISSDSDWIVNRSAANLFDLNTTTVLTP